MMHNKQQIKPLSLLIFAMLFIGGCTTSPTHRSEIGEFLLGVTVGSTLFCWLIISINTRLATGKSNWLSVPMLVQYIVFFIISAMPITNSDGLIYRFSFECVVVVVVGSIVFSILTIPYLLIAAGAFCLCLPKCLHFCLPTLILAPHWLMSYYLFKSNSETVMSQHPTIIAVELWFLSIPLGILCMVILPYLRNDHTVKNDDDLKNQENAI